MQKQHIMFFWKRLMQPENILPIFPFFPFFFVTYLFDNKYIAIHFFGYTEMLPAFDYAFFWSTILFIPFVLHKLLRKAGLRNDFLCAIHIASSILIVYTLFYLYTITPGINTEWNHTIFVNPAYENWINVRRTVDFLLVTSLLLQFTFIVVAIYCLFMQPKEATV